MTKRFIVPGREWNKLLGHVKRHTYLLAGENCRITREPNGTTLRPIKRFFPWRHPWHVTPFYDAQKKHWRAVIKAGFLNGEEPIYSETDTSILAPAASMRLAPLPIIEGIRPFFKALGVRDPLVNVRTGGPLGIQVIDNSWEDDFLPDERLLARTDIILQKPRIGMMGTVELMPGASGNTVIFSPQFQSEKVERLGGRGRIYATGVYTPPAPPTLLERIMGDYTDPQEDTLHLATVWLVSPSSQSKEVDGSWVPYVEHKVFWNLMHVAPVAQAPQTINPLTLVTGLAGGLADAAFQSILSANNDATMAIYAAMQTVSPAGQFFTH